MLPDYNMPPLTYTKLTDGILGYSLELCDIRMHLKIARPAVLQYMTTGLANDETMRAFADELGIDNIRYAEPILAKVAATLEPFIRQNEEFYYKMHLLKPTNVKAAMQAAGVSALEPVVEILLASLAVSGPEKMQEERQDFLRRTNLTVEDVQRIAANYKV